MFRERQDAESWENGGFGALCDEELGTPKKSTFRSSPWLGSGAGHLEEHTGLNPSHQRPNGLNEHVLTRAYGFLNPGS